MKCQHCNRDAECRPYGPGCSMICFDCLTSTPEMEAECKRNFISQLEAAGPVAVIGSEVGPYPIQHAAHQATKEPSNG